MGNGEKAPGSNSEKIEAPKASVDLYQERLNKQHENTEKAPDNREARESSARNEIEQITAEKKIVANEKLQKKETTIEHTPNTETNRKKAYKSIVKQTQAELPPASRAFSKVIHNPVVEKVSEVASSTIARPNAILSGAVFAFIMTLLIYVIARANGYPLSGSETIAAFIIGWIIGIVYDFFKTMVTGKK